MQVEPICKLHVNIVNIVDINTFRRPLTESTELDTAVFLVKGVSIGQTTVSAIVVDKDGTKVTSTPQQIEV